MAVTAPTVDEIVERFPVFDGQEDLIEQLIPEAMLFVNDSFASPTLAVMYYVAHMIVSESSADSYPVTSESLGPISTSYAVDAKADPLTTTEYGRRYLRLKTAGPLNGDDAANIPGHIMVVGGDN
jgi:hypothetical protein